MLSFIACRRIAFVLILGFGALVTLPPQVAAAEPLPQSRIAFIDVQGVLRASEAARTVRDQIEAQRARYQEEISKQERELRTLEQDLVQQRSVLAPEAFQQRRQQFEQRVAEIQRAVQARKRQLDEGYAQSMEQVRVALVEIVADIAKERQATAVLSKSAIVLAEKNIDISEDALNRLNQRLTSVTVKLPPIQQQ
ncbi:MAG: OmpH family outer membrane protein [Oceanibaculum sp.]